MTSARSAGPTKSAEAVRALGAQAVAELHDIASGADVLIVCVFTDEQVAQVCLDSACSPRCPPDAALVIHTTGSPRTAQAIAAHSPGIDVLDAPVSGGPHNIAAGESRFSSADPMTPSHGSGRCSPPTATRSCTSAPSVRAKR